MLEGRVGRARRTGVALAAVCVGAAALLLPSNADAAPATARVSAAAKAQVSLHQYQVMKQRHRALTMLAAVNAFRSHAQTCGSTTYPAAKPLRYRLTLASAARRHAADMATHAYFDHDGLDGSTPTSRAKRAGYSGGVGENIAAGFGSVASVMAAWRASDGHCANLMSRQYASLGMGVATVAGSPYGTYWVQDFGLR